MRYTLEQDNKLIARFDSLTDAVIAAEALAYAYQWTVEVIHARSNRTIERIVGVKPETVRLSA